jgi:hypothetical protein
MEEWRQIEGFPRYEVSSFGNIRSLDDTISAIRKKEYARTIKGQILKQSPNQQGYLQVQLYNETKPLTLRVHRLVAEAFLDKIEGRDTVDHIDRNQLNNSVANLRWANLSEQQINRKHPPSSTGHRCITTSKQGTYRVMIKRNNIYIHNKTFKTLEEALEFRDSLSI